MIRAGAARPPAGRGASSARTTITSASAAAARSRPTSREPPHRRRRQRLGHRGAARGGARSSRARRAELRARRLLRRLLRRGVGRARLDRTSRAQPPAGLDARRTWSRCSTWTWSGGMRDNRLTVLGARVGGGVDGARASRLRPRARSTARWAATATARPTRRRSTPPACRCCTSSPAPTPTTTSPPTTPTRSTPPAARRSRRSPPTWRRRSPTAPSALTYKQRRGAAARGRRAHLQRLARHDPRLRRRRPTARPGVLLAGVRPGGAAEQGGHAARRHPGRARRPPDPRASRTSCSCSASEARRDGHRGRRARRQADRARGHLRRQPG